MSFVWPNLTEDTEKAVVSQLHETISIYDNSGIFNELELRLADFHGVKRCLLTSSGTAALHSIFVGIDLQPGDEILCPSYTFFATVTPILQTGATPILVDCDRFGNMDPVDLKRKITSKSKAVIVTHMWGMPCDMDEILEIVKYHNLLLLEDGSHAHASSYKNKFVGSFGNAAAFSLQAQKTLTGGEGGFILTNDDEIYYRCLLLGHYNKRCKKEIPKDHPLHKFATTGMGLKLRAHPLAMAIANEQLSKLDKVVAGRNEVANYIANSIVKNKFIEPILPPHGKTTSWYAMLFRFKESVANEKLCLSDFVEHMLHSGCVDADIPASTCPLNLLPLFQTPGELYPKYKGVFEYAAGQFPKAENFYKSVFKIPVWDDLNKYKSTIDLYINSMNSFKP